MGDGRLARPRKFNVPEFPQESLQRCKRIACYRQTTVIEGKTLVPVANTVNTRGCTVLERARHLGIAHVFRAARPQHKRERNRQQHD